MKATHGGQRLRRYLVYVAGVALVLGMVLFPAPVSPLQAAAPQDEWPEWRGLVEQMPSNGLFGTWVIGGRTFTADAGTKFEQEHGLLQVGACAEVKYQVMGSGYRAIEIESKEPYKCGGSGGGGTTSGKVYGRVEQMPSNGLFGTWVIGGVTYQADSNTYFEQEHGALAVGACVEVYYVEGTPRRATKIETKRAYKCGGSSSGGGSSQAYGEMYGLIEQMPSNGLFGTWRIGGMSFVVGPGTRFEQEHGPFAVGVLVEVKFYTDANGVHHATKIETKYSWDRPGDDDDFNGIYEGYEGHAYGVIEAMPSGGLWGTWRIGGVEYLANQSTRFEQEHGPLAVGVLVKVKYYLDANNARVARKIETESNGGVISQPNHYKLYGFVEQMPAGGFNGAWVINGVTFMADTRTRFEESHGVLAVGAYVEVEYTQSGGTNWATKIETHVPPGAGPNHRVGRIESTGTVRGASAAGVTAVWRIGGVDYQVTPATDLNDLNAALAPGNTALVNSYTDANGVEVATRITGVNFTHAVYLPVTLAR